MNGQCHALALALTHATGWPMIGIWREARRCPRHVLVRHPSGLLLDAAWAAGWPVAHRRGDARPVDPEFIRGLVNDGLLRPPALDRAREVAAVVLDRLGPDRVGAGPASGGPSHPRRSTATPTPRTEPSAAARTPSP